MIYTFIHYISSPCKTHKLPRHHTKCRDTISLTSNTPYTYASSSLPSYYTVLATLVVSATVVIVFGNILALLCVFF